jgi:hypothetical protein
MAPPMCQGQHDTVAAFDGSVAGLPAPAGTCLQEGGPTRRYSPADKYEITWLLFEHVWRQCLGGRLGGYGLGAR